MLAISVSDAWRDLHSGASIGLLELAKVDNSSAPSALERRKRDLEERQREFYGGFTRIDFLALPVLAAYRRYYKRFKKTYHVLLQIESIALHQKRLPSISPLVDANFLAEMETFVLTAGHDAAKLHEPILIDISLEGDLINLMRGESKAMPPGDMIMRDAQGISCSIIYGQDNRSPISPSTNHVLYVSYCPPGVPLEAIEGQLQRIEEHVRSFSPSAIQYQSRLLTAD